MEWIAYCEAETKHRDEENQYGAKPLEDPQPIHHVSNKLKADGSGIWMEVECRSKSMCSIGDSGGAQINTEDVVVPRLRLFKYC